MRSIIHNILEYSCLFTRFSNVFYSAELTTNGILCACLNPLLVSHRVYLSKIYRSQFPAERLTHKISRTGLRALCSSHALQPIMISPASDFSMKILIKTTISIPLDIPQARKLFAISALRVLRPFRTRFFDFPLLRRV